MIPKTKLPERLKIGAPAPRAESGMVINPGAAIARELCHRYNTHARLVEALENVVVSEFGSIKIAESWEKENKSDCYWHKAIAALRLARERK